MDYIYVIIVVIAVKCANISITTSVVIDTEKGPKDDVRT